MNARRLFAVDVTTLEVYAIAANPAVTGVPAHEWLGLGIAVLFFVHLAQHAIWCMDSARASLSGPSWSRTGNLALDVAILLAFAMVTVSGVLVSGTVLPLLGSFATGYFFWDPVHAVAAKVLLALLLVHIAVHWKWIYSLARKGKDGDRNDE